MSESDRPTSPKIDPTTLLSDLDPLIVAAAADVDDTLLDWALSLTPRERLRTSARAARALRKFVHASPDKR